MQNLTRILHYTPLKPPDVAQVFPPKSRLSPAIHIRKNMNEKFENTNSLLREGPDPYFRAAATLRAAAVMDRSFTSTVMSAYFS